MSDSSPALLEQFADLYQTLDRNNLHRLDEVYADNVVFIDPAHRLEGLPALRGYFAGLYEQLERCRFTIHHSHACGADAYVTWQMEFAHPKVARGRSIFVDGISHLQMDEKITLHRDYFDMGQMLYEHLPLIGSAIRHIKSRLRDA